jgi:hypothetical protein
VVVVEEKSELKNIDFVKRKRRKDVWANIGLGVCLFFGFFHQWILDTK